MHSSTQIFLVIMKVFSYDFGVPGTVQFPLFEVPWEPCLPGEGAAISKPHSTYKFERSLLHVILCRITGKKSPWKNYFGPWKVLDFFPQNSVWTMISLGAWDAWEDRCINQRPIQTAFYKLHSSSIRNSSVGLLGTWVARSLNTAFSEKWN